MNLHTASTNFATEHFELDTTLLQQHERRFIIVASRLSTHITLTPSGIEMSDEGMLRVLHEFAQEIAAILPSDFISLIEVRSQMKWATFIGHCIVWWRHQRTHAYQGHGGFWVALAACTASHQILFNIQWNEGMTCTPKRLPLSQWPLWIGASLGIAFGQIIWWLPWPMTLCIGLTIAWLTRTPQWQCAGHACQHVMQNLGENCPSCGVQFQYDINHLGKKSAEILGLTESERQEMPVFSVLDASHDTPVLSAAQTTEVNLKINSIVNETNLAQENEFENSDHALLSILPVSHTGVDLILDLDNNTDDQSQDSSQKKTLNQILMSDSLQIDPRIHTYTKDTHDPLSRRHINPHALPFKKDRSYGSTS